MPLTEGTTVDAVAHGNRNVTASPTARRSHRSRCAGRTRVQRLVEQNSEEALMGARAEPLGKDIRKLLGGVDKGRSKLIARHTVTELVSVTQDVFGLFERHRVGGHVKR